MVFNHIKSLLYGIIILFCMYSCDKSKVYKNQISYNQRINDTIVYKCFIDSVFFEPIRCFNNDTIINKTDLKVDLLFMQTKDSKQRLLFPVFTLMNKKEICWSIDKNSDESIFFFDGSNFWPSENNSLCIKDKGVYITNRIHNCKKELNIEHLHGVNGETYGALNSLRPNIKDYYVHYRYKRKYGELYITNARAQCGDTGRNPLKIERDGKFLNFPFIRNLMMFEHDIDQDKKKELYIIDFACCENEINIYKVYGY